MTAIWKERAERGNALGVRILVWMATLAGRAPARALVRLIALYYTLMSPSVRRSVRAFLRRVEGRATLTMVYRQVLRFAQTGLDALFLLSGQVERFVVTRDGYEHLQSLKERGQGAILLGAHLGSFYAMRAQSTEEALPVYAVTYTKHARRINATLEALDPQSTTRLLQMGEGVDFMMRIRDLVDQGALIAILADRVSARERSVEVDFLGAPARFPVGPFLLAAALRCPVYMTFAIYREPDRYELHCEPFAERIELPRAERSARLLEYVERYARRLEHYCRSAPDNWFNFYDFWEQDSKGL